MATRQEENKRLLKLLLEVGRKEIFKLADGFARSSTYSDLNCLIVDENIFGDQPIKSSDQLDIDDLCHILKNSPSIGLYFDPAWSQDYCTLSYIGKNLVESCLIIKGIFDSLNGANIETESMFINNAERLIQNIVVLGHNEADLRRIINSIDAKLPYLNENVPKVIEDKSIFGEESISQKLSAILKKNGSIDTVRYVPLLFMRQILNGEDFEKIDVLRFQAEQQMAFIEALKSKGKKGIEALRNEANFMRHEDFANDIKREFCLED